MKHQTKGHRDREVRAPSSGSSGSQPRVVAAGQSMKDSSLGGSVHSVNQSGVQRRYDSIEHQRQSQIQKFLQSPQEQIADMLNQKKYQQQGKHPKQMLASTTKEQMRKQEAYNQPIKYAPGPKINNLMAKQDDIHIVNVLNSTNKQRTSSAQNPTRLTQPKKARNSSKPQALTEENNTESTKRAHHKNEVERSQQAPQCYRQLQQQLALANQRRNNTQLNQKDSVKSSLDQLNQQASQPYPEQ